MDEHHEEVAGRRVTSFERLSKDKFADSQYNRTLPSGQTAWRLWSDRLSLPLLSILLTALLLYLGALKNWDRVVYDGNIKAWERTPSENIVIIAIDERSLSEFGRWPWPRDIYPQLVDQLTRAGAKAVGFDIVFSEVSRLHPEHDLALVETVARNGNVVMPVLPEQLRLNAQFIETMPLPPLVDASAALGHVDHELEDDSIVRSVALKGGLVSLTGRAFHWRCCKSAQMHHWKNSLAAVCEPVRLTYLSLSGCVTT